MERLTIPDEKIDGGFRRTVIDARKVKENAMTIYWKLKAYEDTGLTPEQVRELKERDVMKKTGRCEIYSRICPVCGRPARWRFCPNCGQRLMED